MRIMFSSAAILGVGGWAAIGAGAGPDFEKVVGRPSAEVYDAFASVSPEGEVTVPGEGEYPSVTIRIEKEAGESLSYRVLIGDNEALSATIEFEPAGNGDSTRVTAELDVHQGELQRLADLGGGTGTRIPPIPEALFDVAFRSQMETLTDRVARGEPLGGIHENGSAAWAGLTGRASSDPSRAVALQDYERELRQDAAVRPMSVARPMVDPNESARAYREGN